MSRVNHAAAPERRHMLRAAGTVGFLTLCSRISGLLRDVAVGYGFGTGAAADAFFVAFRFPNLLRRVVGEGATAVAFVPVFTEYEIRRSRRDTAEAARAVGTLLLLALLVLAVGGVLLAEPITRLFAPGFALVEGKHALTVLLTRLTFPYILFVGLVALAMGYLNAVRHFAAPAMAPVLLNASIIVSALLVAPHLTRPAVALGIGVLVGGAAQLLVQVPFLRAHGALLRPRWNPRHPACRRVMFLLLPTLVGAGVYQLNVVVATIFASLLPPGSVSYLWYAGRVFEFPLGVFAVALGTAALPSFASQAKGGDRHGLRDSVTFALGIVNAVALPAAVGIIVLAEPITSVLFLRGSFGTEAVTHTAGALRCFGFGLWSVAALRVVVPIFYALEDPRTPVAAATVAFFVNVAASLLLMGPVPAPAGSTLGTFVAHAASAVAVGDLRHAGLALATSAAATFNLFLLAVFLRQRQGLLVLRSWFSSFARALVAATLMGLLLEGALAWLDIDWIASGFGVRVAALAALLGSGVVTYGVCARLCGVAEVKQLASMMRRRLHQPMSPPA